jgi:putative addiction module component (TIGR02574 family)
MTESPKTIDYSHLSVAERILLAEELWESVYEHAQEQPLSDAQRQEIERRWAAYQAGEIKA